MSDENNTPQVQPPTVTQMPEGQDPTEKKVVPAPKAKKFFTKADIVRSFWVGVRLPMIYPDFEPWEFEFKIQLSKDAEERRQTFLELSQFDQSQKEEMQNLDEIADLLVSLPKGFGDLQDDGISPGSSFKTYVESETDPVLRATLDKIVRGANNLYWSSIAPREFRR